MKDEQLVEQFQQGDVKTFDELVIRYQDKVLNTCFRFIGDSDDARDATQDIFIKVYHALNRFTPKAKFSTWLYRIAVNHSINVRSKKRRAWKTFSSTSAETAKLHLVADNSTHPQKIMEKEERSLSVHKALNQLAENQRTVIILHRFEGLSYKEIAQVMHTSVSAVESRLFRARQKLLKILKSMNE